MRIMFCSENAVYVNELKKEVSYLYSFVNKLTHDLSKNVASDDDLGLRVVFNNTNAPYAIDTTNSLKRLLNELIGKYTNKNNAQEFVNFLKRILYMLDDASDMCGEMLCPILREHYYNNDEMNEDVKKIKEKLFSAHHGYKITGTYNEKDETITLFTKNIPNKFENYLAAFAHEFFHAIHYFLLHNNRKFELSPKKYYHSVVLESLAEFFEIEYLNNRGYSNLANKIHNVVSKYSPIFYPYSGAKYLFSGGTFSGVLDKSLINFKDALKTLIPDRYEVEIILLMKNNYKFVDFPTLLSYKRIRRKISVEVGTKPFMNCHGFPVYIIPNNPNEFLSVLNTTHRYVMTVFYNDGTIESHICETRINDLEILKNNTRTQSLIHNIQTNRRLNDIKFVYLLPL